METNFFSDVYDVVRLIPVGRVTSYGAIARYLGTGGSARMVGWALNSCTDPSVPAHRVVNRQGLLTGKMHFGSGDAMASRLEAEGIRVKGDQILQFEALFWDPARELNL